MFICSCIVQRVQSEQSQLREALEASEKRMDAAKQELGRLRHTCDTASKDSHSALAEVGLRVILLGTTLYTTACLLH